MLKNNFNPFIGIDTISFGKKREDIRARLNSRFEVFVRNEFADNSLDYYKELEFFTLFDANNICVAIEFAGKSNLYYKGENLLEFSFSDLSRKFDSLSVSYEESKDDVTYHDLGFGFNKTVDKDEVEGLIIFCKDYWD